MIQITSLTFSHGLETLYHKANMYVPKNKKAGLVGLNGAGKSTLFSLLTNQEWPDEGKIKVEGSIRLVPQEVKSDPIQNQAPSVREYLKLTKSISDHELKQLVSNMELPHTILEKNPRYISGGQKTKLAILHAVLTNPDILLLDEPTNFLDDAGKRWVMHWLSQYTKTLIVVSHDLNLLDRHLDTIVYINKQTKQFEQYSGPYSKFLQLKQDHDQYLKRYIRNQQRSIRNMKQSVEKLRQSNVEKVIHQRVQLEKRIARLETNMPPTPKETVTLKLNLQKPPRIGEVPLSVKHLKKIFNQHLVIHDLTFSIIRNQRVAILGQNGAGKSTLIKLIMGNFAPSSGTITLDEQASIGYYSQEFETFDQKLTLLQTLRLQSNGKSEGQIRSFAASFMFNHEKLKQQVGSLSGGEKTRLAIALLMLKPYNFLILDEPTTYLDGLSQRIVLDALKKYAGTMLLVSHTPTFLHELELNRAILMPEEKMVYWDDELLQRSLEI